MKKIKNDGDDMQLAESLFENIASLIDQSRRRVASTLNTEITILYFSVGKTINTHLFKNKRAGYGETIIANLSRQLTISYGNGWGIRHLWHCTRVADIFSEDQIVNALSTQLSWTHIRELAAIEDDLKRTFYTELSIKEIWSTRTLKERIASMLFERTALSKKPEELLKKELNILKAKGTVSEDLVFRDPYILDFLGLPQVFSENDFESAILNQHTCSL